MMMAAMMAWLSAATAAVGSVLHEEAEWKVFQPLGALSEYEMQPAEALDDWPGETQKHVDWLAHVAQVCPYKANEQPELTGQSVANK